MTEYRKCQLLLLALLAGFASEQSQAVSNQTGDSVIYKFTGRLQAAIPCTISNDKVIAVEFGNVAVNRLDSGSYIQEMNYTLDCGDAGSSNTVRMMFKETPVPSDTATFASSIPGLWIKMLKDGQPLALNKPFTVASLQKPPRIDVLLVKDPASELTGGDFSATGTLMAEYT